MFRKNSSSLFYTLSLQNYIIDSLRAYIINGYRLPPSLDQSLFFIAYTFIVSYIHVFRGLKHLYIPYICHMLINIHTDIILEYILICIYSRHMFKRTPAQLSNEHGRRSQSRWLLRDQT